MGSGGSTPTDGVRRAEAARSAIYLLCFLLTGLVARTSVPAGSETAVIWPAAGVAALWLATSTRTRLASDLVLLVAATIAVDLITGASAAAVVFLIAANVAGAVAFAFLAHRWCGHLWGAGGQGRLTSIADLGGVLAAAVLSAAAAGVVGVLGRLLLTGDGGPADMLVWWARSGVGTFTVVVLGMITLQPVVQARTGDRLALVLRDLRDFTASRGVEAVVLTLVTTGLATVVIWHDEIDSLTYLLVLTTVWSGLRFSPRFVILHGMLLGRVVLTATLVSGRPFGDIADPQHQALMAQGFLVVVLLTGLLLSLGRSALDRTGDALSAAQAEAAERAALLEAMLASMNEGLVVLDENGSILLRNDAAVRLVGIPTEMPRYVSPEAATTFLRHPDGRPVRVEDLPGSRLLAGLEPTYTDFHVRAPGVPHGRVVQMTAQLLPPAADGTRRAMVNMRDVTADRQHRDALADFAGTVAHDLYTPLTMINGWAEVLTEAFESGPVDPELGLPAASRIHGSAQHLRDVIRDLLAYTVARDQTLLLADIDLSETLEALARLRRDAAVPPSIEIQPGIRVRADHALVRQLFDNLLGNAVKYVPIGQRPEVSVSAVADADTVEIRVCDRGVGIAPEEREHVFTPYHRVDDTGRGTGLGLAICRRIVDRHRGTIRIEGGPDGRGTTVVVTLPAAATPAATPAPAAPAVARAARDTVRA